MLAARLPQGGRPLPRAGPSCGDGRLGDRDRLPSPCRIPICRPRVQQWWRGLGTAAARGAGTDAASRTRPD
ncbi:hypothetical protein ACFFX0_29300 [Citricoccus parietis]|uniref:Uncharacterized protein n=1 Tax=Citricoccus parietis TaxID=592307 RepID=A0ABV5G7Z1_9MICC